jgi:hypothetical protein
LEICRGCDENSEVRRVKGLPLKLEWRRDEHCNICACPLMQKTKALHTSCPFEPPKWGPVATEDQVVEINKALEDAEKYPDQ